jgi:hypothetical protein
MNKRSQRDPREDKILSYQRDRRNTYGESPRASRRLIRFRNAWVNRACRRQIHQQLDPSNEPDDVGQQADLVRRKPWRKGADTPLGQVVERRRGRRATARGEEAPEPSDAQLGARRRGRDRGP